jgi:MoxR-like ATPase
MTATPWRRGFLRWSGSEEGMAETVTAGEDIKAIERLREANRMIQAELGKAIVGQNDVIEGLLTALFANGHVLLVGVPGLAKTLLIRSLSRALDLSFSRIQFTPDLMPSDITGTEVLEDHEGRRVFRFIQGPVFAHIVLADEINRTSPKVQSALLEAMAEKQTTVDNRTRKLDDLFLVIATQNPLDVAGTFPLPNAQLDRFLFKIRMTHIAPEAELEILRNIRDIRHSADRPDLPRVTRTEILDARSVVESQIYVHPAIHQALVDIASSTRNHQRILQGVSTRSLVLAVPALQARALMRGRNYVTGEDIDALSRDIYSHRIEVAPGAGDARNLIAECCAAALERLAATTMAKQ